MIRKTLDVYCRLEQEWRTIGMINKTSRWFSMMSSSNTRLPVEIFRIRVSWSELPSEPIYAIRIGYSEIALSSFDSLWNWTVKAIILSAYSYVKGLPFLEWCWWINLINFRSSPLLISFHSCADASSHLCLVCFDSWGLELRFCRRHRN